MKPLPRWVILWTIAALLLLGLMFMSRAASPPPLPGTKKADRKPAAVTQGMGALDLIAKPALAVSAVVHYFPPHYFAATATDEYGLESDYSEECVWTNNTLLMAKSITLAWDPSPGTNVITNYKVYRGQYSGWYDTNFNAGTNLTLQIPLYPPRLSNQVITITSVNATNLQYRSGLTGAWAPLGATNWAATNPPTRFWRAMGTRLSRPGRAIIQARWQ